MISLFIIGPEWIAAIAAMLTALAAIIGAIVKVGNLIIVVRKGKKKQVHKPLFSWFNLHFFRRSSMKRVSKEARRLAKMMEDDKFIPTLIFFIGRGGSMTDENHLFSVRPVHPSIVERAEKALGEQIPTEAQAVGKFFRKYVGNKVTSIFPINNINIPEEFLSKILIVAGEVHTGGTIEYFIEQFKAINSQSIIKTCVFFKQTSCKLNIDYIGRQGHDSVLMPWQDADFIRESTINLS